MREIKFRGLRTLNGEWVYGNLLIKQADSPVPETSEPYKCYYIVPIDGLDYYEHEIDPDTIEQYTGLKDSEGREIYEGDILVLVPDGCIKHIVSWNKQEAAFNVVSWGIHRARIIGNIHDNPELLEL